MNTPKPRQPVIVFIRRIPQKERMRLKENFLKFNAIFAEFSLKTMNACNIAKYLFRCLSPTHKYHAA